MSSHVQSNPAPMTTEGLQANFETALRIAAVMAEANERIFKVQSEAANAAFAENSKHLKALLNTLKTKDSGTLLLEWTGLYQANMALQPRSGGVFFDLLEHVKPLYHPYGWC